MKTVGRYLPAPQAAGFALIGFAYFTMAVVALYFLNPGYNLVRSYEGNYALAPYDLLIASTFFGLGLGSLGLVVAVYQDMPRSVRSWTGLLLLGMWGVGFLIAGIFPANEAGGTLPHLATVLIAGVFPVEVEAYPETAFSLIHTLAILGAFLSMSLGAMLLSWHFKGEERWRTVHLLSAVLALVMITVAGLLVSEMFFNIHTEFIDTNLSLLSISSLSWLVLTATRLRFGGASTVPK